MALRRVTVPLNSARDAVELFGLQDKDPHEQAAILQAATSGDGYEFDFSPLYESNALLRGINTTKRFLRSTAQDYIAKPLTETFGDNTATQILGNVATGFAENLPELGLLALTRGRSAPRIARPLGSFTAGALAGASKLADTNDTTSALASAALMGATPTIMELASSRAASLAPSIARRYPTAFNFATGMVAGGAGDVADYVATPEMVDVGGFAMPTEEVSPFDVLSPIDTIGRRFKNLVTDPVALGTMLGAEVGMGGIGALMARTHAQDVANTKARTATQSLGENKTLPIEVLKQLGFDVPPDVSATSLNRLIDRYRLEGELSRTDIQRQLYEESSNLTPEQVNSRNEIYKSMVDGTGELVGGVYSTEGRAILGPKFDPDPFLSAVERASADTLTRAEGYEPEKANYLSRMLDKVGVVLEPTAQAYKDHPMAYAVYSILNNKRPQMDAKANQVLETVGQNAEGTLSPNEAINNYHTQTARLIKDEHMRKAGAKILEDFSKNIYRTTERVLKDGTVVKERERLTAWDNIPELSIDQLMEIGGIDREAATYFKNLANESVRQARDTFDTVNTEIATSAAYNLFNRSGKFGNTIEALNVIKPLIDKHARNVVQYEANFRKVPDSDPTKQAARKALVTNLSQELVPILDRNSGVITPEMIKSADTMAEAIVASLDANVRTYAYNSIQGWAPESRRGDYAASWIDDRGQKQYRGFMTVEERNKFLDEAKAAPERFMQVKTYDASKDSVEMRNLRMSHDVTNHLRAEFQRARAELNERLKDRLSSMTDADRSFIESLGEISSQLDEGFRKVLAETQDWTQIDKSRIKRQGIEGINPEDRIYNLLEFIEQNAKFNVARRADAYMRLARLDPSIINNEPIRNSLDRKISYMSNPNTGEMAAVRAVSSLFYLAGSPAFIAQNLSQVPVVGALQWKTYTGRSLADFTRSLAKASQTVYDWNHRTKTSNDVISQMLKRAEDNRVFDQTITEETGLRRAVKTKLSDLHGRSTLYMKTRSMLDRIIEFAGMIPRVSELLNRQLTFTAFLESENRKYPLAKRSKEELDALYQKAVEFNEAVNFQGGRANRPEFLQALAGNSVSNRIAHGGTLTGLALKLYGFNLGSIIAKQLRNIIPGLRSRKGIASRQFRESKDGLALLKTLGIFGAIAGVSGEPLMEAFDKATAKIFGEDAKASLKIRKSLDWAVRQLVEAQEDGSNPLADRIVDVAMYGLPGLLGYYQQNVGASNLLPWDVSGDMTLKDFLGAPGQMMGTLGEVGTAITEHDPEMLYRAFQPAAVRNLKNFLTVNQSGQLRDKRGRGVVERGALGDAMDAVAVAFGGKPLEAQKAMQANWGLQSQELRDSRREQAMYDALGGVVHNPELLNESIEKLVERGDLNLRTEEDAKQFYLRLARASLDRDGRTIHNATISNIDNIMKIYKAYGIDPTFEAPVDVRIRAAQIARDLDDIGPANKLLEGITMESQRASQLVNVYGIPSRLANAMVKARKTPDDVKIIQAFVDSMGGGIMSR